MTTINEMLSPLGDGFRNLYGTTDKYTPIEMTKLLSLLEIHNFLDDGQFYDSKVDNANNFHKNLTGIDVDKWNKYLLGKTVIFSCDIEWSGFDSNNSNQGRIGYEFQTSAEDNSVHYNGTWFYPTTPSGKQYCATKMKIYDKPIQHVDYGSMYNLINNDATVKITNVKMYIYPLGGVSKVNLLPNMDARYLPIHNPANNFDCYDVYSNTKVHLEYGKKYELIAETNGIFSSQHNPNVESDKCVLWLTDDTTYTTRISDENTARGTIFTWWNPTGVYHLRVNAYHKGNVNKIYAYNIRIYEVN